MRALKHSFLVAAGLVIMLLASSCSLSSQAAQTTTAAPKLPVDHFNAAGKVLISDQGNNRVIEIDKNIRQIVWSYGPKSGPGALNNPNSAELLPNGNILIGDENNNRVIEITRAGAIVWQYSQGLSGA